VAQAADKTGWFEVPVSGAGLWRFAADRDTFVEIPGVSIFAADLPGRHFVPDMSKAPAARLGLVFAGDKPAAGDAPGRHGRASGLAARGAVTLDLGRDLGKGRFERFNPDQGTLEFWLRPARSGVHEPRNTSIGRNLLEAGPWSITLYPQGRRSLAFEVNGVAAPGPKAAKAEDDDDDEPQGRPGALSAQASLSLEADRWTHLAFQWRRDGAGFILEVYVDGRLNGVGAQAPHKAVSADNWTPKPIAPKPAIAHRRSSASPTLDAWIDDLRLSSAPRYNQDFTPPAQPFTKDPQTLILLDFDSND